MSPLRARAHGAVAFVTLLAVSLLSVRARADEPPQPMPVRVVGQASPTARATDIPAPAWPLADDGEDVVLLKNGGMVRGYLEELLPGEHARIRLPSGEVRVIEWSRVDHVEQGKGPYRAPAPPAPVIVTGTATPPPPPPVTGDVLVHLQGDEAMLEAQSGTEWRAVCSAPCDRKVPLDGYYRIVGEGVRTSKPFRLIGEPNQRLVLTVDAASSAGHAWGIVLVTLAGAGASIAYCGLLGSLDYEYGHQGEADAWGLTMLASGAVAVGGIGLLVANSSTKISQRPATATERFDAHASPATVDPSARPERHESLGTRTSHEAPLPAWRTAQRDLASRELPRVTTVPLVALRF